MNEPLELFMTTMFQFFINYLIWKNLSVFNMKIFIEIYKALNDNTGNSLKELFVRRQSNINLQSKPELQILWFLRDSLSIEIREDHSSLSFLTKICYKKTMETNCLSMHNLPKLYRQWGAFVGYAPAVQPQQIILLSR